MDKHSVYISIGSNIGDKKRNCENGLERIDASGAGCIVKVSEFYKTQPVNYTDQDWFVNAAAEVETSLSPIAFLKAMKRIERELGTVSKSVRFGPRIIDLDILLYDDIVLVSDELTIPHERMHERVFVLQPLCDINYEIIHPVMGKDIKKLLLEINGENQDVMIMNG